MCEIVRVCRVSGAPGASIERSSLQQKSRWSNAPARVSIGRCFLNLRNSRAKPVGLRFLSLRKRTSGRSPFPSSFLVHRVRWVGGAGENFKVAPIGNPFWRQMVAPF